MFFFLFKFSYNKLIPQRNILYWQSGMIFGNQSQDIGALLYVLGTLTCRSSPLNLGLGQLTFERGKVLSN